MKSREISIKKAVMALNNKDSELGGFWLPNIQRPFVWSEEQITRLFDSIMREYPVSTLLTWSTKDEVKHRKFIDNYHSEIKLTHFHVSDNKNAKIMVLDGQQRLQGFFIGLLGSYEKKELYFNILSGAEAVAPEDVCQPGSIRIASAQRSIAKQISIYSRCSSPSGKLAGLRTV